MTKIYKYIGSDVLEMVFSKEDFCGFKFSYPENYNDPYELFLTINFENDKEIAAFYNEVVQKIQQYPTTCFSRSPIVTPMWAHYAHSSRGYVIEIDENSLKECFPEAVINDVVYQDSPRSELESTFAYAFRRGKPRDLMFLLYGVQNAAYFTKNSCWQYELERRLVVSDDDVVHVNNNMIFYIPIHCVSAIIAGPKTKNDDRVKAIGIASKNNCRYFEVCIGRSSSDPYLLDEAKNTFIFDGSDIVKSTHACPICKEPISKDQSACLWCSIDEVDKFKAASKNVLRMMSERGDLDRYIQDFNEIGKKSRNGKKDGR